MRPTATLVTIEPSIAQQPPTRSGLGFMSDDATTIPSPDADTSVNSSDDANADALASGSDQVDCTIDGRPWVQRPFPYQGKCLGWLREGRAALSASDRADLDAMLAGTGCEALFS